MLPLINREFYWGVLRIVFRLPVCSTARSWDVCILRRRGSPALHQIPIIRDSSKEQVNIVQAQLTKQHRDTFDASYPWSLS